MDVIDLGCSMLRSTPVENALIAIAHLTHWLTLIALSGIVAIYAYWLHSENAGRLASGIVAALSITGLLTVVLTHFAQSLVATFWATALSPSIHIGLLFAVGTVTTLALQRWGTWVFLIEILAVASRLALESALTGNVLSGIIVGTLVGFAYSRRFLARGNPAGHGLIGIVGQIAMGILGVLVLFFFFQVENNIGLHRVTKPQGNPALKIRPLIVDIGDGQNRNLLRHGWSIDETWANAKGKRSVVWATGLASELVIPLTEQRNYQLDVVARPYSPSKQSCQSLEVKFNDAPLGKTWMRPAWQIYRFQVPASAVTLGNNYLQFFYGYAESPKAKIKTNSDSRELSVAFDRLEFLPAP